jgi:hypothetical protein
MTFSLFPTPFLIQTTFVGKSPYGHNTITGNIFSDTIHQKWKSVNCRFAACTPTRVMVL